MNDKELEALAPKKAKDETYNPMRNSSGCIDRTAHTAINNIDKRAKYEEMRYKRFLKAIFALSEASGFHIENRLEVKDLETGRAWR